MGYNRGTDRDQMALLPEALDDFIEKSSYVRFLDDFVDKFDFQDLGFKHGTPAETGRPPFHPGDLLKLYIYGSLNRLTSTRELANACRTNVEVMWLMRRLQPDFRTIAEFRKHNREAIRKLFRSFVKRLKAMGVVVGELIGIDGSKFAASNSKDNNYTEKKLTSLIEYYDRRIEGFMQTLDENDSAAEPDLKEQIQRRLDQAKERQQEKKNLLERMKDTGEKQISTVDPDSRRMKSGDGTVVGYNVQMAVDAENKLIVDVEITNSGNDAHQLEKMASTVKEILQQDSVKVAADTGYYSSEEIVKCEKAGIETYVSKPKSRTSTFFTKNDFIYSKEEDLYICPAEQKLTFTGMTREHGRLLRRYQTNACKNCLLRSKCTPRKKRNRVVTRFPDEDLLNAVQHRIAANPDIRSKRKSIVEHPFGTLKRRMFGRFLTRGLQSVATEALLAAIAYDFGRLFKFMGSSFDAKNSPWRSFLNDLCLIVSFYLKLEPEKAMLTA